MTPAEIVMRLHPYQNLSHERTLQKPFPLIPLQAPSIPFLGAQRVTMTSKVQRLAIRSMSRRALHLGLEQQLPPLF